MDKYLVNRADDTLTAVHLTTDHPDSHYGIPVWVDDKGKAWLQYGTTDPIYYIIDMPIGKRLARLRKAAGYTAWDLAAKIHINASTLSLVENGKTNPTWQTVETIVKACGRDIDFV